MALTVPQDLTPFQRKLRGQEDPAAPTVPAESKPSASVEDVLKISAPHAPKQDVSVRVLRTAAKLGQDRDLVASNLEEAEKIAAQNDFDPEKFRNSPVVARWYASSLDHIAVAKPDAERLKNLESLYYRKDDPLRPLTEEEYEPLIKRMGERRGKSAFQDSVMYDALGRTIRMFPTEEAAVKFSTDMARQQVDAIEKFIKGRGPAGAFEMPGSLVKKIPIAGSGGELGEAAMLLSAMKAVQSGTATDEDEDLIFLYGRLHAAAASRGQSFGGKVLEGVAALPGFAAEYALTGGAFRAGKAGAEIALRRALQKVLTGRALGAVAKVGGVAVAGAAQTAAQIPLGSLPADAIRRMMPSVEVTPDEEGKLRAVLMDDGDDFAPAFAKAFGARMVENLSERSGEGIAKALNAKSLAPMKAAVAARWFKLNPGKKVTDFLAKASDEAGFHGILSEVMEERIGEVGRAALGIEDYSPPTLEDLAAEGLTFAVPALLGLGARGTATLVRARANQSFFKNVQKIARESETAEHAPEIMEDLLGRLSAKSGNEYAYVPVESWVVEAGKFKDPEGQPIDPKQMALGLGVSEASYERALRAGGSLQIPMAPFVMKVLRDPQGDAFLRVARTDAEDATLPEAETDTTPEASEREAARSAQAGPATPMPPEALAEAASLKDPTVEESAELEARAQQADAALADADMDGALETLFPEEHRETVERARSATRQAMVGKLADGIRRKRTAEYRKEREEVRREVEAEINERKEYVALSVLQRGTLPSGAPAPIEGLKIDRDALAKDFRGLSLSSLPRGVVAQEGSPGVHPDLAAEILGYSSGSELFIALIDAEFRFPRETLIEDLANTRMVSRSESVEADPVRTHEEALKALHNTDRSKLLIQDLKRLISDDFSTFKKMARRIAGAVPRLEDVTRWAEAEVRKESARTLHPGIYRRDAKAAHREALDAFLKGDFQRAFDERLQELRNNELAVAAQKLQEEAAKVPKFMRRFQKRSAREALAKAGAEKYLDPIDDILERFEFSPVSASTTEKRASFREWYEAERKAGRDPVAPEKLLADAYRTNWKDLPLSELLELRDTVENIAHLAKLKNKLLTARERKEFDEVAASLVESMRTVRGDRAPKSEPLGDLSGSEVKARKISKWVANLRKASNIALELDGWKAGGPFWESFILPLNRAQEREQDMAIKGNARLMETFNAYTRKERRQMSRREYIPEIKQSLSMWDRIAVALNWGNVDNREALKLGYDWNDQQVDAILSALTERDWRVVTGIWSHLETYWPEIKSLAERVDGIAPEKVEASPFTVTTADGKTLTLQGGYYPLKYKPDPSKPHQTIEELTEESMRGSTFRAGVKHNHRKGREGSGGRKVRIDLGVLTEHTRDVVHDLTHYEWLLDANKLLRDRRLADEIRANVGDTLYQELLDTVNSVALNNRQTVDSYGKAAEWLARRTQAATLAGSVTTILKQYLGFFASGNKIGWRWTLQGIWEAGVGTERTRDLEEWIQSRSVFMKNRRGTQDRDQADALRKTVKPGGESGAVFHALEQAERMGFELIGMVQWHVDRATWIGAYRRYEGELGIERAGSEAERKAIEEKAAALADQAVRDAQGSGLLADLPAVMRQRGTLRLFTIYKTFMINQLNLFAEKAFAAKQKPSAAAISQAATAMISLYIIPQMLWDMGREALVSSGDDEDDDERSLAGRALTTGASEVASSFPFLAEVAPVVQRLSGEGTRDYRGPAGVSLIAETINAAGQARQAWEEGETDLAFWRAMIRSINAIPGTPTIPGTAQLDRIVSGYYAWEEEEAALPAIFLGRPRPR